MTLGGVGVATAAGSEEGCGTVLAGLGSAVMVAWKKWDSLIDFSSRIPIKYLD